MQGESCNLVMEALHLEIEPWSFERRGRCLRAGGTEVFTDCILSHQLQLNSVKNTFLPPFRREGDRKRVPAEMPLTQMRGTKPPLRYLARG